MGRVDVLFRFLQMALKDTPRDIEPYLRDLDEDTERRPLVDQIVDRILAQDPALYKQYADAQREVGSRNPYASPGEYSEKADYDRALVNFLSMWVSFESNIRSLAKQTHGQAPSEYFPVSKLVRDVDIPAKDVHDLAAIIKLRNETVHGINTPEPEQLNDAAKALEEISTFLRSKISPSTVEIFQNPRVRRTKAGSKGTKST
jgi:hypothetical protein